MTYDPVHHHWLPVPRPWVMADLSRYAYPANDGSVHVVDLATGTDTILPNGDHIGANLLAVEPDGVYGAPDPLTLARVDWSGVYAVVNHGHYSNTIAVGDGVAYGSKETAPVHDIDRIDLRTGASTPWFRWADRSLQVLGVDSGGFPVVLASSRGERLFYEASAASTTDQPMAGQPLAGWIADVELGTVTFVQDQNGFWFETAIGLVRWDAGANISDLGSGRPGFIAGSCL
jgi:hypothetical protein